MLNQWYEVHHAQNTISYSSYHYVCRRIHHAQIIARNFKTTYQFECDQQAADNHIIDGMHAHVLR